MLKSKLLFVISFLLATIACTTVKAPQGTVPKRTQLLTEAYGGWIGLRLISPPDSVAGELIAYSHDSVYLISGLGVTVYPLTNVSWARVIFFRTESDAYAVWTTLGSLLTISNGGYAVFTFPITFITGIATTVGEAKRINYVDYPVHAMEDLSKFARFPQGIPKGLNVADLRPRPAPHQPSPSTREK